jgi:ABC-type polysaccharide/polyol phosphate transport system ATPase subunit
MTNAPLIQLESVSKEYNLYLSPLRQMMAYFGLRRQKIERKLVLDAVSLQISPGERVGIVGRNGSGKTTLLKLIIGHTKPSCGWIKVQGEVQALMQTGYGFNDELTGLENIRNALVYNGLNKAQALDAEADIVDFVELGEFLNYPLKTYSLGMRARLEFAAATAIKPDVLVIDEVLGAGDGYFVTKCAKRIRQLMYNTTLLLVSHSLDQIREYCDRVIWIDAGRIRVDGNTQEVLDEYRTYMVRHSHVQLDAGLQTEPSKVMQFKVALFEKARASLGLGEQATQTERFCFADGQTHRVMDVGDAFSLELDIHVPQGMRPTVLGFSDQGAFIFQFEFDARPHGRVALRLHASKLGVGVGSYILFPALYSVEQQKIVHLDDCGLALSMSQANWSDPPLVHLDGIWKSGKQGVTIASKVSGWV